MKKLQALAALILLSLGAAPTYAKLGPPVRIEINDPGTGIYPVAGQPFTAEIKITADMPGIVSAFDLRGETREPTGGIGETWGTPSFDLPPGGGFNMTPGQPEILRFTCTPNDPTDAVVIGFDWEGQYFERRFNLLPSPVIYGKNGGGADETVELTHTMMIPEVDASAHVIPEPIEYELPDQSGVSEQERLEDAPRAGKKGYNIRVRGRLVYQRNDGITVGADGATVRVMDEDWEWDDTLSVFATDVNGYFDKTFWYSQSEDPDIYFEFEAANSKVEVEETGIFEWNYVFKTGTWDDYGGTNLQIGTRQPASSSLMPCLHILTNATRTWRWVNNVTGYNVPSVDIQWPESEGSFYDDGDEEIHISPGRQWNESTIAHEYGHHWTEQYVNIISPSYCNGVCDGGSCGHCLWCGENASDAWQEGWANMLADFVTASLAGDYGLTPNNTRNMESIQNCGSASSPDPANITEGHVAALLRDIIDSAQDNDPAYSQGNDDLDLTAAAIFNLVDVFNVQNPQTFIALMYAQYPSLTNQIWGTCENNGYNQTDTTDPSQVTNLTSTSHSTIGDSPDATITYAWTAATDNLSGIGGYSYSITASPSLPNQFTNMGAVTSFTTPEVSPGTYYFNLRSVDRAGNWDNTAASFGPITIREPYPADMRPNHWASGWAGGIVPSLVDNCGFLTCGEPSFLIGNSNSTYFNLAYENHGDLTSTGRWRGNLLVDGRGILGTLSFTVGVPAGAVWTATGLGPGTVQGGRHLVSTMIDYDEQHAEMNEADNRWGRQWNWSPLTLSTGQVYSRTSPPDKLGGFTSNPIIYSPNFDGYRFIQYQDAFYATVMWADDNAVDYDMWMYPTTNSATTGWGFFDAWGLGAQSGRPAGCLDMVLFNHTNAGSSIFDAGVFSDEFDFTGFKIVKEWATNITLGSDQGITIPSDRHLALRQVVPASASNFTVEIDVDPAAGPVQLALYGDGFGVGTLLAYDAYAVTDENGHAQVDYATTGGKKIGIAVFQDPKDVPAAKMGQELQVQLKVDSTPPDLTSKTPIGWTGPLVPTDSQGTPGSVIPPSTIPGNSNATYINAGWTNAGPNAAAPMRADAYVDGQGKVGWLIGSINPGATVSSNVSFPVTVKGGRHTLHMRVDSLDEAAESDETNNGYGRQWVWTPLTLGASPISRVIPEPPTAGWADALEGGQSLMHFNCDGLRSLAPTPVDNDGHWVAVATMPGANSDVDVRQHHESTNIWNGFDDVLSMSGWSMGQSDFVLTNFRNIGPTTLDIGVVERGGSENYTVERVESQFMDVAAQSVHSGLTVNAGRIMNLHEVYLQAGPMGIVLEELSGGVDWGLSVHEGSLPYHGKYANIGDAIAWLNGPGELEAIYFDVPVDGWYALAVWKNTAADLPLTGSYQLSFLTGATDVPLQPLAQNTGINSVHPNPFNPRTTVAFEMDRPGRAKVSVFNLRGERVAVLLDESRAAGHHQVIWTGLDHAGRQVASGTYFARLEANGVVQNRKMTLLK